MQLLLLCAAIFLVPAGQHATLSSSDTATQQAALSFTPHRVSRHVERMSRRWYQPMIARAEC